MINLRSSFNLLPIDYSRENRIQNRGLLNFNKCYITNCVFFLIFEEYQYRMRKLFWTCAFCLIVFWSNGQDTSRQLAAVRTSLPIKIDGDLNDDAWKFASIATGFIEMRPSFGKLEDEKNRTEVYLLYDDNAIYLGGLCRETSRDSIATELLGRDRIGVNDFIGIILDTYQDKINGLGFYVTPLGEQFDLKYSLGFEDDGWSSVYQTHTKITNEGWTFEMRIPYSAIRFSKINIQNWGINFIRRRAKSGQQFSWNPIDPAKFGFMNQAGILTNIENIKPPLRLSFSPYFSTYINHNPDAIGKKWGTAFNGGMDVKFGISKGFTLDMTLIPDFGQVQSDNQVLNLTPFEVRFEEKRSFFTEGTELFNKGNFFYSRRVGGMPIHYYDVTNRLASNETIIKNPTETKLINATKISGRTPKNLGIGFFNAITRPEYAIVEDENKFQRKIETNPLTNYNVFVLDQTMKNNSSVTFVNTNTWRSGKDYDANVMAGMWDLYDNQVKWNFWGHIANSRLMGYSAPGKTLSGYYYNLFFGKFKGAFNFEVHRFMADDKYDQRDMGYFRNNNYLDHGFWIWYKWLKPKGFYNNMYLNIRGNYSQMLKPRQYQYVDLNIRLNGQFKNLWSGGLITELYANQQDFYESRVPGKMVRMPGYWTAGFFLNSNQTKKYSAGIEFMHGVSSRYNSNGTDFNIHNNYRFNDKLGMGLSINTGFAKRDVGFAYIPAVDSVVFGLRDRHTVENIFNAKYNFNNKMGITFRARHYWSKVHYTRFFDLQNDGNLRDKNISSVNQNPDNNANFFNIDMIYTWEFAAGSFINIAWKTNTEQYDQMVHYKYYPNLRNTINDPQQNSFSVKVIYYLDYLTLKGKRKRGVSSE